MSTRCTYSRPILWDAACSYTYLCACESSVSCKKNQLYGKPRPACAKRSCYKECFGKNAGEKLREWYRSSVHTPTQKCTQLNGIDSMHVTKCGVRVCHHHPTGLLCTGLCTQQFKCIRLCEPAWVHVHVMRELKIVNKRQIKIK